jgi:hypothetical protein
MGVLVLTPFVLVWSRRPVLAGKSLLVAEAGLLWLAVLGLGLCVFERWNLRGIDTGYLAKHLDATFTHGACPECAKKLEAEAVVNSPNHE